MFLTLKILIPIFTTIIFFLYIIYKTPKMLKLPGEIKKYREIKNIFKIFIAIFILTAISGLLGGAVKTYMNMSAYYFKEQIYNQSNTYLVNLDYIIMVPINFVTILYLAVLFNLYKIMKIPFKRDSSKKTIGLISFGAIVFLVFLLSSYAYYRIFLNYLNYILKIL